MDEIIEMFEKLVNCKDVGELKSEIGDFRNNDQRYKILKKIYVLGLLANECIRHIEYLHGNGPATHKENQEYFQKTIQKNCLLIIDFFEFFKNPESWL